MQRQDFGAVQPRNSEESDGEESIVQEECDDADDGCAVGARADGEGHGQEATKHTKGADHEHVALSEFADNEEGQE